MAFVDISVVLGTYNRINFLTLAIDSIRKELSIQLAGKKSEIIVVDGGSSDGSLEWLLQQKDIITIVQHNRGEWLGWQLKRRSWGYFMNLGFKCAQGKYICMVSDDCLLVPSALKNGYEQFEQELSKGRNVGGLAFYWRDWPKNKLYSVGCPMGFRVYINHGLYLKKALEKVDYIDEEAFSFYFADIDLCFRIWQAGYEVIDANESFLEHYPYASLEVRKTNTVKADHDFKTLLTRWAVAYPALTNHNISNVLTKEYKDPYETLKVYQQLHDGVVAENKEFFREPTRLEQHWGTLRWYTKIAVRKLLKLVRFYKK